jgi:hypothetical protein
MWPVLSILSHALSGAEGEVEGRRIQFADPSAEFTLSVVEVLRTWVFDADGEVRHASSLVMQGVLPLEA